MTVMTRDDGPIPEDSELVELRLSLATARQALLAIAEELVLDDEGHRQIIDGEYDLVIQAAKNARTSAQAFNNCSICLRPYQCDCCQVG